MLDEDEFDEQESQEQEFDVLLQSRVDAALWAGARASGIPWQPFTDVQKREANAYGEAMAAVAAIHICGILDANGDYQDLKAYDTCDTRHPVTGKLVPQGDQIPQMLASERLCQYLEDCSQAGERLLDTRQAPGYVETDPLTANRLYVLTNRSNYAVALEIPYDWPGYLHQELGTITKCDVHLLHRCYDHQATKAVKTLAYKRGEYVFGWKICDECLDALSWVRLTHPDYAGPLHKWVDDREGEPREEPEDPWLV
jgi:hypothetical protein